MKQIEGRMATPKTDETKLEWQKPEVSKISAGAAEGGDNFSGEGGGGFS